MQIHVRESFYFHITLQSSLCNFTQNWFLYQTLNSEVLEKNSLQSNTYGFNPNCVPYYKGVERGKVKKKYYVRLSTEVDEMQVPAKDIKPSNDQGWKV